MSMKIQVMFQCDHDRHSIDRCGSSVMEWFHAELVEVNGRAEAFSSYEPTRVVLEIAGGQRLVPRGWGYLATHDASRTDGTYCEAHALPETVVRR